MVGEHRPHIQQVFIRILVIIFKGKYRQASSSSYRNLYNTPIPIEIPT